MRGTREAFAALLALAAGPASGLEFKVGALVQASAQAWRPIPPEARLAPSRLSFKRRALLEGPRRETGRAGDVERALAAALAGVPPARRDRTRDVLAAVGGWLSATMRVDSGPPPCPSVWRDAGTVLASRGGHAFEIQRAATAMVRAAGLPARPTYNGVPVLSVYVTVPGEPGYWTVWNPLGRFDPSAEPPVLWLPLRAAELPPVRLEPETGDCRLRLDGKRFARREDAERALEAIETTGRWPDPEPLEAAVAGTATRWWEVWAIGARLESGASEGFQATVPLPFLQGRGYGTRAHVVWVSDPGRLERVSRPLSRTDQRLGGLELVVKLTFAGTGRRPGDA